MTPPQYFWEHGMWVLPFVMMTIISLVMLAALYLIFGRGDRRGRAGVATIRRPAGILRVPWTS